MSVELRQRKLIAGFDCNVHVVLHWSLCSHCATAPPHTGTSSNRQCLTESNTCQYGRSVMQISQCSTSFRACDGSTQQSQTLQCVVTDSRTTPPILEATENYRPNLQCTDSPPGIYGQRPTDNAHSHTELCPVHSVHPRVGDVVYVD